MKKMLRVLCIFKITKGSIKVLPTVAIALFLMTACSASPFQADLVGREVTVERNRRDEHILAAESIELFSRAVGEFNNASPTLPVQLRAEIDFFFIPPETNAMIVETDGEFVRLLFLDEDFRYGEKAWTFRRYFEYYVGVRVGDVIELKSQLGGGAIPVATEKDILSSVTYELVSNAYKEPEYWVFDLLGYHMLSEDYFALSANTRVRVLVIRGDYAEILVQDGRFEGRELWIHTRDLEER